MKLIQTHLIKCHFEGISPKQSQCLEIALPSARNDNVIALSVFVLVSIAIIMMLIFMSVSIGYAASTNISVTAVVLSKSNCKFNSKTAAMSFGNLDPANSVDVNVTASITFICHGSANPATFSITHDGGLYETGPNANRMRHLTVTSEYLPYNLSLSPSSGTVPKNTNQTLTISGTVKGTDYQDVNTGNYSDTVVLSIAP